MLLETVLHQTRNKPKNITEVGATEGQSGSENFQVDIQEDTGRQLHIRPMKPSICVGQEVLLRETDDMLRWIYSFDNSFVIN